MTSVFIITHASLYAEGLSSLFARDGRIRVVGSANGWRPALECVCRLPRPPDVLLLDLDAPEGVDAVRGLSSALSAPRLIALTASEDEALVILWGQSGVAGLLSRDSELEDLVCALQLAARGETAWSPSAAAVLLDGFARMMRSRPGARSQLTSREREIVALIDRGLSNKEIASELQIELPTVKNHVHHLLNKLNARRRGEAAAILRGEPSM